MVDYQDQEWDYEIPEKYSGVFKFKIWRFGTWEEVLVDDFIPTQDGAPIFSRSRDENEWWPALMEKAFAKLHGSYEALDVGSLSDALVDLTGGVSELISLEDDCGRKLYLEDDKKSELYKRLQEELNAGSLVCCAVRAGKNEQNQRTECGLVKGHAYGVTGARRVSFSEFGVVSKLRGKEKV